MDILRIDEDGYHVALSIVIKKIMDERKLTTYKMTRLTGLQFTSVDRILSGRPTFLVTTLKVIEGLELDYNNFFKSVMDEYAKLNGGEHYGKQEIQQEAVDRDESGINDFI